jgi:hypothetical protein
LYPAAIRPPAIKPNAAVIAGAATAKSMILSIYKLAGADEHRMMARIGTTTIATAPWRAAHVRATTYTLIGWGFDIAIAFPSL